VRAKILDGELSPRRLRPRCDGAKLADLAVTTDKIAQAAVTNAQMRLCAVDTAQIALGASPPP
jgi:hypothetical protein